MNLDHPVADALVAASQYRRPSSMPPRHEPVPDGTLYLRWRDRHDIAAARQLASRHRWLVAELAGSYRDSGLPWEDLLAEASVGLMRAICRFDPDRGIGFATYGTWWVNAALEDYVRTRRTGAKTWRRAV